MEQKHPADIYTEVLDHLWNGLGLEEKGWKRLKKGDFKKRTKNGLTYLIWFERSRYNYLDYEIGLGNVEVGFSCTIKLGNDLLYESSSLFRFGRNCAATSAVYCQANCSSQQATL